MDGLLHSLLALTIANTVIIFIPGVGIQYVVAKRCLRLQKPELIFLYGRNRMATAVENRYSKITILLNPIVITLLAIRM